MSTRSSFRAPRRKVWLVLLTYDPNRTEDWTEALADRIRSFWEVLRSWCRSPGELTYFSWLELTKAGNPHYHAMLVDPPFRISKRLKERLESAWGLGFVKVQMRDSNWFERSAGGYVAQYAKKIGEKEYQQNYATVPRSIRTFQCNRLEHSLRELSAHEPRAVVAVVDGKRHPSGGYTDPPRVLVVGALEHVGEPCTLPRVTKRDALARRARKKERRTAAAAQAARALGRVVGGGVPAEVAEVPVSQALLPLRGVGDASFVRRSGKLTPTHHCKQGTSRGLPMGSWELGAPPDAYVEVLHVGVGGRRRIAAVPEGNVMSSKGRWTRPPVADMFESGPLTADKSPGGKFLAGHPQGTNERKLGTCEPPSSAS
jgi:hypothetical protein